MSFKSKAAQAQLVAFYNNQWLNIPFQSIVSFRQGCEAFLSESEPVAEDGQVPV
jgi:hypothetical protein